MRTYLNISTGPKDVGRCPHRHKTPAEAAACAEDRLQHAREVSGQPQFDVRLEVVAADPDTGPGTATLPLDANEGAAAAESRRQREAHHQEHAPEDDPTRKALELEQYRRQWACALSRNIHASLERAEAHARRHGFTRNPSLTYVDQYGWGEVFNARAVRFRVTHEETGEIRRYEISRNTGEANSEVLGYSWHSEEHLLAEEAKHDKLLAELDRCSNEGLTALFGRGNEPRREYLRRGPDVEHAYRREDWPPQDADGGTHP